MSLLFESSGYFQQWLVTTNCEMNEVSQLYREFAENQKKVIIMSSFYVKDHYGTSSLVFTVDQPSEFLV